MDVITETIAASAAVEPTIAQFTSPIYADVPIAATAVCAADFTARIPAAFAHFTVFTDGFNTQFFNIVNLLSYSRDAVPVSLYTFLLSFHFLQVRGRIRTFPQNSHKRTMGYLPAPYIYHDIQSAGL